MNQLSDIGNYTYPCTMGTHLWCDGEVDLYGKNPATLRCDCPCHYDQTKTG